MDDNTINVANEYVRYKEHYISFKRDSVECIFCGESESFDEIAPDCDAAKMALLGGIDDGCPYTAESLLDATRTYIDFEIDEAITVESASTD